MPVVPTVDDLSSLYLDLLQKILTRTLAPDGCVPGGRIPRTMITGVRDPEIAKLLAREDLEVVLRTRHDPAARAEGRDWPLEADTMIGDRRMDNLRACVTDVVRNGVPGDLMETGVWRGGATIFMRAILKVLGDTERCVWVADSFQGLPKPDAERYPADRDCHMWTHRVLAVSEAQVRANFAKYGLLDDQVRFLPGWFRDTLPTAPVQRLAVLRLDGDLYESTILALRSLYPKLSPGGYLIVDDYSLAFCKAAVEDYRAEQNLTEEIIAIDYSGVYWKKR